MNDASPGGVVGDYRLDRLIDDTGRSQVWVAHDERLDRNAALKLRRFADAQAATEEQARFTEQARTAARIEHPGVIPVYGTGLAGDIAFLAMRYVHGRNLAQWQRSYRGTEPHVVFRLMETVAAAIDHAHALGLAHGSLTAEAIVIDESATPNRAVLLPFAGLEGGAGTVDPREAEADRIAFAGLLQSLIGPQPSPAVGPSATSCLEILRASLPAGDDGPPTPQTVIRTRRTRSGRTRLALGLSTAAVIIVAAVTAAAFLDDVADQLRAPVKAETSEAEREIASNAEAQPPSGDGGPRVVLILGDDFDALEGAWERSNRSPAWRFREGANAADVVEAAFAAIPSATDIEFDREPLNTRNPASCNAAVGEALDRRKHIAIVVLQSPCSTAVIRQIGAREAGAPPVYWLDNGLDSKSLLVPMAVAPLRNAEVTGDSDVADEVRRDLGSWTGTAAARVLPFGTYSDVGRFAKREFDSSEPCMYLPTATWNPADEPLDADEQLRINHSIFEIGRGFDRDPAEVAHRAVWIPYDDRGTWVLPKNGSVLGSQAEDEALVSAIRGSGAPCVVAEVTAWPANIGLPWSARLLTLLAEELPSVRIIHWTHPNDPYRPGEPRMSAVDARAWREIMENNEAWALSSATYTPPDSALSGHVWEVAESMYRPVGYDRTYGWWTDHYGLILVAELISRQTVDPATGRQQFGSIPNGDWADAEVDFVNADAAVALDPVERIYSGYLVTVHRKGELWDAFYGGATE